MIWVKALHIISMITWFAGLFYLPRLFVYHADCHDEIGNARFKIMEFKLYVMMNIGALLTFVFGIWLLIDYAWEAYIYTTLWLPIKLLLVTLLLVYHHICGYFRRVFRDDNNQHSHTYYRWFNEVPVLILIAVVLLAVGKPF